MEEVVDKVKLFEFEQDNRTLVVLTGVISQIYNRMKDTGFDEPYSLRSLLNTLEDRDLDIDPEQFREMIKRDPLKNLIKNIKGDEVYFKGVSDDTNEMEPDQSQKILAKMASKAVNLPK